MKKQIEKCGCLIRINTMLEPKSLRIERALVFEKNIWTIPIPTVSTDDSKRKTPSVFATHCPFCGVKL